MKQIGKPTAGQCLLLVIGAAMAIVGAYHLILYTLGYPISFSIPGTPIRGVGSKVSSVYLIVAVLGIALVRRTVRKTRVGQLQGDSA